MTSTHLDPTLPSPAVAASAESKFESIPVKPGSPSADSSFSDAYNEEERKEDKMDITVNQSSEVSDDYAMTFDSDGEERTDSKDIAQANIKSEPISLPAQITLPSPSTTPIDISPAQNTIQPGPAALLSPPSLPTTLPNFTHISENSDTTTTQIPKETADSKQQTYEAIANGDIDIQQLLDNITANAEKNEAAIVTTPTIQPSSSIPKPSFGLLSHSSLPPRPNLPQTRPYDDPPTYHANTSSLPPAASSYRPPGVAPALIAAGAPGTSSDPRGGLLLPPPPSASFYPPSSALSPVTQASSFGIKRLPTATGQKTQSVDSQDEADELDTKWGPEVQRVYDQFLDKERAYVTEGLWDRFPVNSRLFIGNLPSEKVTKRDIFHVFHPYGKIAQISIKQAYGFVQFHDSSACYLALDREQGAEVRGKKMHLEISKPQKNTRNVSSTGPTPIAGRRSKSPDYVRGNMPDRGGHHTQGARNGERYDRSNTTMRSDEYGRPLRVRDDYRPVRQATPPRGNLRSRDDYSPRDSYDGRERRRSRSPPFAYGQRDNGRYRERSMSPRAREAIEDDDLQIPRRDPRGVPDVQIILMDQLDRAFVSWVETEMRNRGVNVEIMFLSPRLPLQAVIRRQIIEGVHAVSKLDMRSQNNSKIPLQVFDRQGGANNVRFDEYQDLDPKIAAELVLRAKQTPEQVQRPQAYSQPQYAPIQLPYQQPVPAPAVPNLASLVGQLDNATLQKLLGTLQPQQQSNGHAVAANTSIDLASLLGGFAPQQPPPQQQSYQPQPQEQASVNPYASLLSNPALAALLQNNAPAQQPIQAQPPPQQSAQQVQNIMAQLARFR
ncbi:related to RNA-binding protein [Rhynchosporium graminicola]|uniref:Related to RNA-binding protein n=1 Tax=Rhynchosporium graminicola TaxID=2792576 RepID=A0A1E1KWG4_9HELO|nr:related to RNA-binding protein [Rhynchosporium commune]